MEIATFTPQVTQAEALNHIPCRAEGRYCASVALMPAQTAELCSGLCNGDEFPQPEVTYHFLKENSF